LKALELSVPPEAVPDEVDAVQVTWDAAIEPPDGGVKLAASARIEMTNRRPPSDGQLPPVKVTTVGSGDPEVATLTSSTVNETPVGIVMMTVCCAAARDAHASSNATVTAVTAPRAPVHHGWPCMSVARPRDTTRKVAAGGTTPGPTSSLLG
jgi:hypothetical protein